MESRTSLLTGHSGVGKSSLLNALEPGLARQVGSVTHATAGLGKGKHTTASARLLRLSAPDTFVVDSPGIRAFGINGLAPHDLAVHFPDVSRFAAYCGFRDCLHDGEQGCDLPPENWSRCNVSNLGRRKRGRCQGRGIHQSRSSASCVKQR